MQRYHAAGSTNAANNSALGGASTRDASRVDSSSLSSNFSINSRRLAPLAAYKLKCEKEPLNSRLGPPDFHPQSPNCPEENLTREYVQSGYRETVEGLEETREISLTQVQTFNKPAVIKCKESIRKCLRAINESRAQKRKAGQVYGVPLSGSLLTKHGVFPEQKPCSEDSKKKWIEGLSQPHKRLRYLADHVPHGYRRKALFEVLVKNNVPLLRATWFIKVSYLNQVRPNSSTGASSTHDRTQLSRTELWTKDVIEFLQHLLDEFSTRTTSHSVPHNRDRSQMLYAGSMQQKNDPSLVSVDGDEPSLNFKWWYVVRLLHWHHSEGLLLPSLVIDWLLAHLQEKDLLEILQLFLPIIYGFLEAIVLSQTYVRTLATVAVRFIRETSPGGSDLVDNSRRAYTTSALAEMLRYLILAVPDTFVALDCFPLPPSVLSYAASDGTFVSKSLEDARRVKDGTTEVGSVFKSRAIDSQYQTLSFGQVVSSIQKRADNLARAVSPGYSCHNVAKAVQALDKALFHGDVRGAYSYLFEQFCDEVVDEGWIEEVSPSLRSSLKRLRTVNLSFVCSVFFLCEWATSEYRDFRTSRPNDLKLTGKEDIAQVYIACRLLNLKIRDMQGVSRMKIGKYSGGNKFTKGPYQHNGVNSLGYGYESKNSSRTMNGKPTSSSDLFESPGPLHDVIVCWIDQHEADKGKGLKRLQLLIVELMRAGIFHPHAYVRQLIISGIMDSTLNVGDLERKKRHYQMLKQLPGSFIGDVLEEGKLVEGSHISETMRIYSNERRLLLQGILCGSFQNSVKSSKEHEKKNRIAPAKDDALSDHWKTMKSLSSNSILKRMKTEAKVEKLKASIALLLQFPKCSTSSDSGPGESTISAKRSFESVSSKLDVLEGTPGCEECKRAKRQKLGEETSSATQGLSPVSDDEDTWWMRKMPKTSDPSKVDPPIKSSKQAPKSRQKVVRKTQSLAQLAAARIENSQGASTSHVCDSKISCPHHRTAIDGENLKTVDGTRAGGDIISVGKALKQLRLVEKRLITVWLKTMVIQLVENTEKIASKANQYNMPFVPDDDRNSTRWKLGEDELSVILYLMDVCNDLVSAAKFLLWLLPKVQSHPSSTIHSGRSVMMLQRNMESHACEVGEPFWLSSLRRISGSTTLVYSRYLLKRYGNVPSIAEWEKSRKPTYDKRLISELDSGRSPDGEFGFPLGVPAGVDDPDDFLRQKISGNRISRVGIGMRDVVQRHIDDTLHCFLGKERKIFGASALKGPAPEKLDDGYHVAHQIVMGLMECMRQTGGAAQEGDPSLVSSAVSAIVNNIGPAIVKIPDVHPGNISVASSTSSLTFAQRVLHIHISCLRLLKEALGERQSRVFEIALATEACSALAAAFSPGKASRGQYQMSPDAHDSSANISNESNSAKGLLGKGTKSAAAVSALIIGTVIYGVTNLERLVTVFRLKEGLDVIQFVRSTKTNSNGNARAMGALKVDNLLEVYVHWFRVLVGNCRTVSDGFIVELLGEPSIVALSRMQRILPLSLVLPPAYSIFALVLWRPFILSSNLANREDIHLLYQSLTMAIGDAIKHLPFRDVCLRDSQGFYDLVTADACDADFAAILDLNGLDMHVKSMAFVPLRGRLFLNSVIDGKLPNSLYTQDDGKRTSLLGGSKLPHLENEMKLMDKLVKVLDALQPAKFHWQWVELRLLLNEQALTEKLETRDMSLADAIRSSSPGPEKGAASENENKFIELILTRLLVRPDAAPLFSELVHLFGRSLEDSMLLHVKWFLGGQDVLFGRKTIRQRLVNIAESKGLSTKAQFWKPWGWSSSRSDLASNRGDKKFEVTSIEEGEVVDDGTDTKKSGKGSIHNSDLESFNVSQHHVTEKALIELVLPCIDQGSEESRNTFASDLIKQLNNIELQINAVTRGVNKQAGTASPGLEGPGNKVSNRKGMRGGSPGLARRTSAAVDSALPSPAALRTSMSLRLQLLLRLLPTICIDGEPSGRNMKHMLATVILRLLGSRVVYENSEVSIRVQNAQPKRESECLALEAATANLSGESLFDRLLLVLHGLVSNCKPSWLKSRPPSKVGSESIKDSTGFDRELVEGLQSDLDRMQLPSAIRWRIQAAMPILLPSVRCSVSCQPPSVPIAAVAALQPAVSSSSGNPPPQRNSSSITRSSNTLPGKSKQAPPVPVQQDSDIEIDPWLLLEDGTGSGPSSVNTAVVGSSDQSNLRASNLLKGAVRIRRTDLTYIGAVDDDS
ncbi:Mediator of RNA polymerase II transcription subunit 12 [Linum perenne]